MKGSPILQLLIALCIVGVQGWGLVALLEEPAHVDTQILGQTLKTSCLLTISTTSPPDLLEIKEEGRLILSLKKEDVFPYEEEFDFSFKDGLELEIYATWSNTETAALKLELEPRKKTAKSVQLWTNNAQIHDRIFLKWQ